MRRHALERRQDDSNLLIISCFRADSPFGNTQKHMFQAAALLFLSAWEPFFAAWKGITAAWEGFQAAWKAFFPAWKGFQAAGAGFFWPRERLQGGKKGGQTAGKAFAAAWKGFKLAEGMRRWGGNDECGMTNGKGAVPRRGMG